MKPHELERIRRSLAMSPSLTPGAAAELIAHIERIQSERSKIDAIAAEFERLASDLRRLA